MKILILGGDGYLGWPTALSFSKKKHDVIVVDNFIKKKMELEFGFKPLIPQLSLQERAKKWNLNQDNPVKVVIGDLLNHRFVRDILFETFLKIVWRVHSCMQERGWSCQATPQARCNSSLKFQSCAVGLL